VSWLAPPPTTSLYLLHFLLQEGKPSAGAPTATREGACAPQTESGQPICGSVLAASWLAQGNRPLCFSFFKKHGEKSRKIMKINDLRVWPSCPLPKSGHAKHKPGKGKNSKTTFCHKRTQRTQRKRLLSLCLLCPLCPWITVISGLIRLTRPPNFQRTGACALYIFHTTTIRWKRKLENSIFFCCRHYPPMPRRCPRKFSKFTNEPLELAGESWARESKKEIAELFPCPRLAWLHSQRCYPNDHSPSVDCPPRKQPENATVSERCRSVAHRWSSVAK
jgi:hypothetical protein